jgi:hypothetical protein
MPLDLLLKHAGEYERTHQVLLQVLFAESRLAEHLGLGEVRKVLWEYDRSLFDLGLEHGKQVTGIELKMWSEVRDEQAERQRRWAGDRERVLAYVLLGYAELEGVPGDRLRNEHHVGAEDLRRAANAVANDDNATPAVRGLADSYSRWLSTHITDRRTSLLAPASEWRRLEYAAFYDRVRATLGWPASIYPATNRGGPVHILNFDDDWKDLNDRRASGASLYWEIIEGFVWFKFGPIPERSQAAGAVEVRAELRDLLLNAAERHGIEIVLKGRSGSYMALGRGTFDLRSLVAGGALDEAAVRDYVTKCRKVHLDVARRWDPSRPLA